MKLLDDEVGAGFAEWLATDPIEDYCVLIDPDAFESGRTNRFFIIASRTRLRSGTEAEVNAVGGEGFSHCCCDDCVAIQV